MTCSLCFRTFAGLRVLAPVVTAVLACVLAGCQTIQPTETTGAFAAATTARGEEWRRSAEAWGDRYRANPKDPEAAINYAQALRGNGQRSQAVAVLEQASMQNPRHTGVLGAYGRALADAGNYQQALEVLARAHQPDQPDWRILSVQGAVLDQLGRHEEAQRYYATALRIVPDEPSVLSNLGLSYALSKDLRRRCGALPSTRPLIREYARTWRLSSACRAASRKRNVLPAPICRPSRRLPTSLISARCWRSRTAGSPVSPPRRPPSRW
jgi:Flp pilus assembly protein TadD